MTKKEKLHLQKNNLDKAIAFKEGFFYKVYNEGAFLLKENSFKIQSNGKGDFICVYVGFPEIVLQNMKNDYAIECVDDCFYIQSSSIFDEVQYNSWYESQISIIEHPKSKKGILFEEEIMKEISQYPLANKTPIEVFMWVSTLQSRITENNII